MKLKTLAFIFFFTAVCRAQAAPASDPTLDETGLPWAIKTLPKPAPEPWQKITSKQRLALYQHDPAVTESAVSPKRPTLDI
jgi:hypothetical protein